LVTAAALYQLGMDKDAAIELIRSVRSGMLRNPAQIVFLNAFKQRIEKQMLE